MVRDKKVKLSKARASVREAEKADQSPNTGQKTDSDDDLLQRYGPILVGLLNDIASASKTILFADCKPVRRNSKKWQGRLYILHPKLWEAVYTFSFDRSGAEVTFEGERLWPIDQQEGDLQSAWDSALAFIETEFLEDLSVLVAEAEAEDDVVRARYGTKKKALSDGRRWATFADSRERALFVTTILGEDWGVYDEDDFYEEALTLEDETRGWDGSARGLASVVADLDEFDDEGIAAYWELPSDWHVARIPDSYIEGFVEGARRQLAYFKEQRISDKKKRP